MSTPGMSAPMSLAPFGVLLVAGDGTVLEANSAAGELLDREPAEMIDAPIDAIFPASVPDTVPSAFPDPDARQPVDEYFPGLDRWLEVSIARQADGGIVYIDDASERKALAARSEELDDELDRVTGVVELISAILVDLVEPADRESIAETICRHLGEASLYEFAWVGERNLDSGELALRAAAGREGRTIAAIEDCLRKGDPVPEGRVLDTAEPAHVHPVGEDPTVPEPVRRAAFADGVQSLMAVPLVHGEHMYGVLGIYAADGSAMSDRELTSFETLGEMAGFAINAARQRSMLHADTVVALALSVDDPDDPLQHAATTLEASLDVLAVVPRASSLLCYVTVENTAAEDLTEALPTERGISAMRTVVSEPEGGTIELAMDEETPIGMITTGGGTIRSASYDPGGGELALDLPPDADVRRFVDSLTDRWEMDVVRKREREREASTAGEFRESLADRLTEKQERALRTAFFADYFESPRGSTAEDVATALDISSPTLLYHLRAAQRKLLDAFFTQRDRPPAEEQNA